ncbi:hypothetical protein POM88_007453 [Heracleum sosnowskyi]|uniref:Uncharacterized protein n=1 Tax=Heracleum sosnowskyi TaxID=360622 RepID=A0AAD8N0X1_9APIA|nr:hypothetical protein POM88_007453 [Heracleum sosnowskyi]
MIVEGISLLTCMRAGDIYLSGFQGYKKIFYRLEENANREDKGRASKMNIDEGTSEDDPCEDKVEMCLMRHGFKGQGKLTGVGDSYPSLQEISGTDRTELSLGLEGLKEAVRFLGGQDITAEKYPLVARHMLFLSQFIAEPLRQKAMLEHLLKTFLSNEGRGVRTPLQFIINQHAWAICSEFLIRLYEEKATFEIHMDDPSKRALEADVMLKTYGILKQYEGGYLDRVPRKKPEDTNVRLLYMKSLKALKGVEGLRMTSNLVDLGTEEQLEVSVFKYFSRSHVVSVDFSSSDATYFIQKELKPLKSMESNLCGQLYVVFKLVEPEDVACGKFRNTLIWEENGTTKRSNLRDLDLTAKDYILKVETPNFEDEWKKMIDGKRKPETLFYDSPVDFAKMNEFVEEFLGLQVCKAHGTEMIWQLSGFYIGRYKVLAKVEPTKNDEQKLKLKLKRCKIMFYLLLEGSGLSEARFFHTAWTANLIQAKMQPCCGF